MLARRSLSERSTSAVSLAAGRPRPSSVSWLPAALLGAGIILGLALWSKWGLATAFEAVRAYCF